jgi:hypothetical protein
MNLHTRVPIAFAALAVALWADYWLLHRPEPHGVAEFNPIKAKLGREELILASPTMSGSPLLSHQGGKNEVVEIFFEKGVLAPATQRLLRGQPWAQSREPQYVSYTTLDTPGAKGPPCRTSVEIKFADLSFTELRLFQDGIAGGEEHRELSLKAKSRIQVDSLTVPDDPEQTNEPGCRKLLQAGENRFIFGATPLSVLAEAGSSVRFKFLPASATPLWDANPGLFEPFPGISLEARSVRLSPIDLPQRLFMAAAPNDKKLLVIDQFLAGSDTLETNLSGVGWVTVNDVPISPTLAEWISASSLRAGVVGFLNLVIFCGAILFCAESSRTIKGMVRRATRGPIFQIPSPAHGLIVFLCHCSEDKPAVREIDRVLKSNGFQPWLDEDNIFPAQLWDREIKQGLRSSQAVIVCLSKTFARKEGYVQKELRYAIDIANEKPEGAVFLIPVRLENCEILPSLAELQFIDWFQPNGRERLLRALRERAKEVGMDTASAPA